MCLYQRHDKQGWHTWQKHEMSQKMCLYSTSLTDMLLLFTLDLPSLRHSVLYLKEKYSIKRKSKPI